MCGIAGFVGSGSVGDLQRMGEVLIHRGPDGSGFYVDNVHAVFLAHRRLAVLDIEGGHQPMYNEDGQVVVVFNGEIYNHAELRHRLVLAGHVFRSDHSDTEVLVHGYEEWGDDLPTLLNGMFAFVIYDKRRHKLLACRDRFGKKPLYYLSRPGLFAFASELTALLQHPEVRTSLDASALRKYFAYGFIPAPKTLYRDVAKLPGGHCLVLDILSGKHHISQYWRFKIEPFEHVPPNAVETWGEELRSLLSQAVKRRLVSDVPVGVFLSGGIDSSAVVAMATQHVPISNLKTFAIGFREPSFDESHYARRVARHFRTDHHERFLTVDEAGRIIPGLLARLDEPMSDSSIVPTYMLSKFAREHVTVALGGDGGDELFAGYDPFKALPLVELYQRIVPSSVHKILRSVVEALPSSASNMSLGFKIRRTLRGASYPPCVRNPVWLGPLEPSELGDLFGEPPDFEDLFEEAIDAWNSSTASSVVDRTLEFYTKFYLQDVILTKVDRASMMVSLEVRAPFLDNDVVEFARRIPHQFKLRGQRTKYLLKEALAPLLPMDVIHRKKKGFGVPLAKWLQDWPEEDIALKSPAPDEAWVHRQWTEHRAGKSDNRLFLWGWIVLQKHLLAASRARRVQSPEELSHGNR